VWIHWFLLNGGQVLLQPFLRLHRKNWDGEYSIYIIYNRLTSVSLNANLV
jgi:hypothetical protein